MDSERFDVGGTSRRGPGGWTTERRRGGGARRGGDAPVHAAPPVVMWSAARRPHTAPGVDTTWSITCSSVTRSEASGRHVNRSPPTSRTRSCLDHQYGLSQQSARPAAGAQRRAPPLGPHRGRLIIAPGRNDVVGVVAPTTSRPHQSRGDRDHPRPGAPQWRVRAVADPGPRRRRRRATNPSRPPGHRPPSRPRGRSSDHVPGVQDRQAFPVRARCATVTW
jgi:hypothetical protein